MKTILCPSQLSPQQLAQYQHDGFIAFHDVLSASEIEAAKTALLDILEILRPQQQVSHNSYGEVWRDAHSKLLVQFQSGHEPQGADDPDIANKVRKYHDFVEASPTLGALAYSHPKIGGVIDSLLGENAILSQDMALVNPPRIGTGKPWHQDDAYFKIVPLDAVCGLWIALDESNETNGCMHFWPGAHRNGALRHYHGSDCEIVPDRLNEAAPVAVPLPPGGAVFFCGIAPHMTRPNSSDLPRRALQFHYRAAHSRFASDDEYNQIFAEADGTPASCAAATQRGF